MSSYPSQIILYKSLYAHWWSILESTIWEISYLGFFREKVEYNEFEHKHMENWIDKLYRLWKTEGKQ